MQTLRSSRQNQKKKSLHFPCASSSLYASPAVLRSAFPLADQSLIAPFQHLKLCIVHRHSHEKLHLSLLVFRAQMPMVFATIETTCATPLYPNKKGAVLSAQPREQLQKCNAEKSDRNGVAHVDQDRVEGLRQSSMYKNISLTRRKLAIHAHPSPSEVPSAESIGVYLTIPPITPPAVDF